MPKIILNLTRIEALAVKGAIWDILDRQQFGKGDQALARVYKKLVKSLQLKEKQA